MTKWSKVCLYIVVGTTIASALLIVLGYGNYILALAELLTIYGFVKYRKQLNDPFIDVKAWLLWCLGQFIISLLIYPSGFTYLYGACTLVFTWLVYTYNKYYTL